MKKLFLLCLVSICCTSGASNKLFKYWGKYQADLKELVRVSRPLYANAEITRIYQDGVRTKKGQFVETNWLGNLSPNYQDLLKNLVTRMRDLKCGMLLGDNYTAFYIQSGGVLASDGFIVNELDKNGLPTFSKDITEMELHIVMKKEIEQNWFLITVD